MKAKQRVSGLFGGLNTKITVNGETISGKFHKYSKSVFTSNTGVNYVFVIGKIGIKYFSRWVKINDRHKPISELITIYK